MTIQPENMLYVRPSSNNMHTFVAAENSCFFDVCLPNYTETKHNRKITYFKDKEMMEGSAAEHILSED